MILLLVLGKKLLLLPLLFKVRRDRKVKLELLVLKVFKVILEQLVVLVPLELKDKRVRSV
jgi:hypothetical protein